MARAAAEGKVIPFPSRKDDEVLPAATTLIGHAGASLPLYDASDDEAPPTPPQRFEAAVAAPDLKTPVETTSTAASELTFAEQAALPAATEKPAHRDHEDLFHDPFFSAGEQGRYDGGPLTVAEQSQDFDSLHGEIGDKLFRTPEQEARRQRLIKWVSLTLGAVAAVLFVGAYVALNQPNDAPEGVVVTPPVIETPAPAKAAQADEPRADEPPPPEAKTAESVPVDEEASEATKEAPAEPEAVKPEPAKAEPPASEAAAKPAAPKPAAPPAAERPKPEPARVEPPPATERPEPPAPPISESPPTKSFPID
jgi:hypothetical protein